MQQTLDPCHFNRTQAHQKKAKEPKERNSFASTVVQKIEVKLFSVKNVEKD
jgi:hypothetical protein